MALSKLGNAASLFLVSGLLASCIVEAKGQGGILGWSVLLWAAHAMGGIQAEHEARASADEARKHREQNKDNP